MIANVTKLFLKRKFEEYYRKAKFDKIRRIEEREFAFVPLALLPEFVMHRHISFKTEGELRDYILSSIPAHIYHSSAYYEKPDEGRMEDKGWKGADLIFDIDADHIPVRSRDFKTALKRAKLEAKKLVMVLKRDFGIDDEDLHVFFSGGRGYHIHVTAEEFLTLESAERREIVDYLLITNPKLLDGDYLVNSNIARRIFTSLKRREGLNHPSTKKLTKGVVRLLKENAEDIASRLRIYIDAPVTADVKRLIRMPDSLHGKTGLRVTEVEDLDSFNPLQDAVVFGDEKIPVKVMEDVKIELCGEKFRLKRGEKVKIPEFAAIFLMCRGAAEYLL